LTPAIDPASTKIRPMSDGAARAILQHLGLAAGVSTAIPSYDCTDGSTATLAARPTVLDSDGAPDWSRHPVVVSLARWDRIKDPLGILDGFLERVLAATDAQLLLAGPDANEVAEDPEAAAVLADVRERWRRLSPPARGRVHLACLAAHLARRERCDGQRDPAPGRGRGQEKPAGGVRPRSDRGDVEGPSSRVRSGVISRRSNICTVDCWSRTLLT
jgi:hypothetical protein